jgi:Tfp pilus assembly protein PilX
MESLRRERRKTLNPHRHDDVFELVAAGFGNQRTAVAVLQSHLDIVGF